MEFKPGRAQEAFDTIVTIGESMLSAVQGEDVDPIAVATFVRETTARAMEVAAKIEANDIASRAMDLAESNASDAKKMLAEMEKSDGK